MKRALYTRQKTASVARLSFEELAQLMVEMSELAYAEGVLALDGIDDCIDDPFLKEGLVLVTSGTDRPLVQDYIEDRRRSTLRLLETRCRIIIEGTTALQNGYNAWMMSGRLSALYEAAPETDAHPWVVASKPLVPERVSSGVDSVAQLRESLEHTPVSRRDFAALKVLFADLTIIARREGILALEGLHEAIDEELMSTALRLSVEGREPESLRGILRGQTTVLLQHWETRLGIMVTGILSLESREAPRLSGTSCRVTSDQLDYSG